MPVPSSQSDNNQPDIFLAGTKYAMQGCRLTPDVGLAKQFLKPILEVDVVVVRKHGADDRLPNRLGRRNTGVLHGSSAKNPPTRAKYVPKRNFGGQGTSPIKRLSAILSWCLRHLLNADKFALRR